MRPRWPICNVAIFFAAALRKQARLVTSSVVLTEILRGSDRDTKLNHVLILTADATHLPGLAGDRKGVRVQNVKDIRSP